MSRILVYNKSTKGLKDKNGVTLDEKAITAIVATSNLLVKKVAEAWEILPPTIIYRPEIKATPDDWVFQFIDVDPSEPGAAAYHYDDVKHADGVILVKTILDGGGFILSDPSLSGPIPDGKEVYVRGSSLSTVAGAFFHEVAEALINSSVNSYWLSPKPLTILHKGTARSVKSKATKSASSYGDGSTLVPAECCDPVQQNFVILSYQGVNVALSDFILPAWKDANEPGPYNYIKSLPTPFTVDFGGYSIIVNSRGQWKTVFSQSTPEWIQGWKSQRQRVLKSRQEWQRCKKCGRRKRKHDKSK